MTAPEWRARGRVAAVLLVAAAVGGCATTQQHEQEIDVPPEQMNSYLSDKPEELHRLYAKVLTQGERNAVLNHTRAGLAAMQLGYWDTAERSFDQALLSIEAVYAENEDAEKARSIWVKENYKAFKGEPYERAMAYYYRGLLYLREGDYENARASFKGGLLQDTLAQVNTYSQDFALLSFLSGWASHCNGNDDLAETAFEEAREHNAGLRAPSADARLLLVGETGLAPRKVAVGEYGEALALQRATGFRDQSVDVDMSGGQVGLVEAEDVFFQANTRGGREVERILEGQAQFKDASDTVGDAALVGGAAATSYGLSSGNDGAAAAGLAVMAMGLVAKGMSAATRPDADVRTWDNLPDKVHLAAVEADPVPATATAKFLAEGGQPMARREFKIHDAGACAIGWARAHDAAEIPDAAPGSAAGSSN